MGNMNNDWQVKYKNPALDILCNFSKATWGKPVKIEKMKLKIKTCTVLNPLIFKSDHGHCKCMTCQQTTS